MIRTLRVTEYHVFCDECHNAANTNSLEFANQKEALHFFRSESGWRIGKKCLCPECVKKAKEAGNAGSN